MALNAPCGYSLIADLFGEEESARANSIYGLGIYVGQAVASFSNLLNTEPLNLGWRVTSICAAVPGLLLCGLSVFDSAAEVDGI